MGVKVGMDKILISTRKKQIEDEMKDILMAAFAVHQPKMGELQKELFNLQAKCDHTLKEDASTFAFNSQGTCIYCGAQKR